MLKMKTASILLFLVNLSSKTLCAEFTKVLVAGGNGFLTSVEVIDLEAKSADQSCMNLPDLPVGLYGGFGRFFGGAPVICGGGTSSRAEDSCKCFALKNGGWERIEPMNECRRYAASTILKQNDGEVVREVLLVGGGANDKIGARSSIEVYRENTWSKDFIARLPNPVWLHCIVQINSSHLISIGGYDGINFLNTTYFYNIDSMTWTKGPELNFPRYGHSCDLMYVTDPDTLEKEAILVVAGGYDGTVLRTSEVLFLEGFGHDDKPEFLMGPTLPRPISLSQMVQYNDTVVVVGGGYGSDGYSLYQLDSLQSATWKELPAKIVDKRRAHVAFLIPDEFAQC